MEPTGVVGRRACGPGPTPAPATGPPAGASARALLRVPSEDLGRLVGEWFPFGEHMIVGIYQTVRGIEATARQRESLVALGTLAAGLAHEINNPAAAAARAADALRRPAATRCCRRSARWPSGRSRPSSSWRSTRCGASIDPLVAPPPARWPSPTARRSCRAGSTTAASTTPGARSAAGGGRRRRRLVRSGRATCSVGHALGPASSGWRARCRSPSCCRRSPSRPGRISHLVEAVKSYSQMDRASLQRVDVTDGIESTLVMLGHKLGDGVDGRSATSARTCPGSRPTPVSSTRCGPT